MKKNNFMLFTFLFSTFFMSRVSIAKFDTEAARIQAHFDSDMVKSQTDTMIKYQESAIGIDGVDSIEAGRDQERIQEIQNEEDYEEDDDIDNESEGNID